VAADQGHAEGCGQTGQMSVGGGLIGGDPDLGVAEPTDVDPGVRGVVEDLLGGGGIGQVDHHGVEEVLGGQGVAAGGEGGGQPTGLAVGVLGDLLQPSRTVIDGVEAGADGQQRLGRADVGSGLLSADVLFAGLQSQPVGRPTGVISGDA